jgi:hypothetical protein
LKPAISRSRVLNPAIPPLILFLKRLPFRNGKDANALPRLLVQDALYSAPLPSTGKARRVAISPDYGRKGVAP